MVSIFTSLKCVGSFLILSLRNRCLEVVGERENGHARLLLARPFFLVPTTSILSPTVYFENGPLEPGYGSG